MATVLPYGDTIRYPSMRHEVPLEILDPFLFVARDDEKFVLTSSLEALRIAGVLPEAELLVADELGFFELVQGGASRRATLRINAFSHHARPAQMPRSRPPSTATAAPVM